MTVLDITAKLNIHHSIELSWMNAENKPRNGPPERWTRFSVEQMDPKTHTYSTVYMSVFSGLEPRTSYGFRLRVTRASGECSLSPVPSVFTTREIFDLQTDDVDVYDKMGFSPLMVAACFAGHLDTVKYLHNCGSTWQSQDTDSCTPLHWAVDGGHLPVITTVTLENVFFLSLWTPLMRVSTISGNAAVASILLQAGADVNVRDKAGKTPLMVFIIKTQQCWNIMWENFPLRVKYQAEQQSHKLLKNFQLCI
uniref:Fibronectin type III and ankyrin repeat domains 1 n=1 Tax=Sinocyclocheilus grahami TaxID=75366 RepID=A0A672R9W2_SINGR